MITFDGRGNGRSDRPAGSADAYAFRRVRGRRAGGHGRHRHRRAVLVVALSLGGLRAPAGAPAPGARPGPGLRLPDDTPGAVRPGAAALRARFEEKLDSDDGLGEGQRRYWRADYRGFLEFFFSQVFTEPHSTKQIEDGVGWGLETTPRDAACDTRRGSVLDEADAAWRRCSRRSSARAWSSRARRRHRRARRLAPARRGPGGPGRLVELAGSGHAPHARDPVKVNLLIREFVDRSQPHADAPSVLEPRPRPPQAGPVHLLAHRARARPAGPGHRR